MIAPRKPRATANQVNAILNAALGTERFPVNVIEVAKEISRHWNPSAPITQIEAKPIEGFEGLLQQNPDQTRWRIFYGESGDESRQRFTIAHEFGHFALHRDLQSSFECSDDEVAGHTERDIELEADLFASTLLIPLDDLRKQMESKSFDFDLVKHCAKRYGVSLTAAARQAAEVCDKRVVVAVIRDGAISRSWASTSAFRSGVYLASRKQYIEVPEQSIAHESRKNDPNGTNQISASVWFPRVQDSVVSEHILVSHRHESSMLLLVLPKASHRFPDAEESDDELLESTSSRFQSKLS